ncbi:hypothetical protein BGW80DRAFT_1566075 [Lactifluus volemus]|nr:hypothetical protein BGW80DRAFT_1566075 [Lactifluus volemus]
MHPPLSDWATYGRKRRREAQDAERSAKVADIVCDVSKDETVKRLLTFKSNASLVLSFPASSSSLTQDLRYALHNAFSNGFQKRHNKPTEMIAHHIDKLLRKGQGSSSDEVFNEQLDAALHFL